MKYDISKIMKRAWEIKNEDCRNIFGECLRVAWAEAKAMDKIEALEDMGFNRWTKAGMDRMYINASSLGLICQYYKTGNISDAEFAGERISNSEARRMKAAKTFVDLKTGRLYSDNKFLYWKAMELYMAA